MRAAPVGVFVMCRMLPLLHACAPARARASTRIAARVVSPRRILTSYPHVVSPRQSSSLYVMADVTHHTSHIDILMRHTHRHTLSSRTSYVRHHITTPATPRYCYGNDIFSSPSSHAGLRRRRRSQPSPPRPGATWTPARTAPTARRQTSSQRSVPYMCATGEKPCANAAAATVTAFEQLINRCENALQQVWRRNAG